MDAEQEYKICRACTLPECDDESPQCGVKAHACASSDKAPAKARKPSYSQTHREEHAVYVAEHREPIDAKNAARCKTWHENNRERHNANSRKYYRDHSESIRVRAKERYHAKKERERAAPLDPISEKKKQAELERRRAYARAYYHANRERKCAMERERYHANKEREKEKRMAYNQKRSREERRKAWNQYYHAHKTEILARRRQRYQTATQKETPNEQNKTTNR